MLEQDAELGVGAAVTPVYMGDEGWRHEWADWVLWSDTAMKHQVEKKLEPVP